MSKKYISEVYFYMDGPTPMVHIEYKDRQTGANRSLTTPIKDVLEDGNIVISQFAEKLINLYERSEKVGRQTQDHTIKHGSIH